MALKLRRCLKIRSKKDVKDSKLMLLEPMTMKRPRSPKEKPGSALRVPTKRSEEFSSLPLMSTRARKIKKDTLSKSRSSSHKRNLKSKEGSKTRAIKTSIMGNLNTEIRSFTKRGFEDTCN